MTWDEDAAHMEVYKSSPCPKTLALIRATVTPEQEVVDMETESPLVEARREAAAAREALAKYMTQEQELQRQLEDVRLCNKRQVDMITKREAALESQRKDLEAVQPEIGKLKELCVEKDKKILTLTAESAQQSKNYDNLYKEYTEERQKWRKEAYEGQTAKKETEQLRGQVQAFEIRVKELLATNQTQADRLMIQDKVAVAEERARCYDAVNLRLMDVLSKVTIAQADIVKGGR